MKLRWAALKYLWLVNIYLANHWEICCDLQLNEDVVLIIDTHGTTTVAVPAL